MGIIHTEEGCKWDDDIELNLKETDCKNMKLKEMTQGLMMGFCEDGDEPSGSRTVNRFII
jgi:hypothetical protein